MAKPQKFCIYCGGPNLTKEHLYANWLRAYIPREATEHHASFTITFPHKAEHTLQRRTGDTHARRLRCVCLTCNRGWMSDLQEATKPYLVPMLEGKRTVLSRKAQKIVAAWATMTAMTAEFLNDEMVAVPQNERDHLREAISPPRTWRIWIARYDGKQSTNRWAHNVMALTKEEIEGRDLYAPAPSNTQTTAIGFGDHLFVYAMSSEVAWGIISRWRFPTPVKPLLRQIWPAAAASIVWPPGRALTISEADNVANEFFLRVTRQMRKATRT